MEFLTRYSRGARNPFNTVGPSLTEQAHKSETDINLIVKRHRAAGVDLFRVPQASFCGDVVDVTPVTFMEALNVVVQAEQAFADLPAHLRKRFNQQPSELLGFLQDPANYDEALKLGLVNERPVEKTVETVVEPGPASP